MPTVDDSQIFQMIPRSFRGAVFDDLGLYAIQQLARGERSAEGVTVWVHPKTVGNDIIWTSVGGPILVSPNGRAKLASVGVRALKYLPVQAFNAQSMDPVHGLELATFPTHRVRTRSGDPWLEEDIVSFPRLGSSLAEKVANLDFEDVDVVPLRISRIDGDVQWFKRRDSRCSVAYAQRKFWRRPINLTMLEIIESISETFSGFYRDCLKFDRFYRTSPFGIYWISHSEVIEQIDGLVSAGEHLREFEALCDAVLLYAMNDDGANDCLAAEEFAQSYRWLRQAQSMEVPHQIKHLEVALAILRSNNSSRSVSALRRASVVEKPERPPLLERLRRTGRETFDENRLLLWTAWPPADQRLWGWVSPYIGTTSETGSLRSRVAAEEIWTTGHLMSPYLAIEDGIVDALAISRPVLEELFPSLVEDSLPITVVLPDGSLIASFSLVIPSGRYRVDRSLGTQLEPRAGFEFSSGDFWIPQEPGQGRFLISEDIAMMINSDLQTGGLDDLAQWVAPWAKGQQSRLEPYET